MEEVEHDNKLFKNSLIQSVYKEIDEQINKEYEEKQFKNNLIKNVLHEIESTEAKPNISDQYEKFKVNDPNLCQKFKEHSVKNATILAAISAPESYATEQKIYEKVNINELDNAEHIADMKLNNIKGGKQGHSSKWPCLYGECTKFEVSKKKGYKPTKEELKLDGELAVGDIHR